MSDLYAKLGPEGRKLISGGIRGVEYEKSPQELDFLINELRFPKPTTTVSNILGYLYHYLPYIKQEYNLRVLISSFLNCTVCYGPQPLFSDNYSIIEVFKLITEKKLKISQPTLPIKTYYLIFLKELTNFVNYNPVENSWKVLPIISGMLLADELTYELYTKHNMVEYKWFFYDWNKQSLHLLKKALNFSVAPSQNDNITYLSLLSLAVVYKKGENISHYTTHVSPQFVVHKLVELMFESPKSANVYLDLLTLNSEEKATAVIQTPVIRYINKLSFVLEAYIQILPHKSTSFDFITQILQKILQFNRHLNLNCQNSLFNDKTSPANQSELHRQFWYLMKLILFAEIVVFQGILTRFAIADKSFWKSKSRLATFQTSEIALLILNSLYYTNFILVSIGQGGFDSYNFVYYLSNDLAIKTAGHFESMTMHLIGNYQEVNLHPDVVNNSYIVDSKIIFVLGLWENYLQQNIAHENFKRDIFEISFDLANTRKYHVYEITEASHSVLLVYFSQGKAANLPECLKYVDMLFQQHPQSLSATQLNIAIETIGKKILSTPVIYHNSPYENSAEQFLEYLYEKCYLAQSVPISQVTTTESGPGKQPYEFQERIVPNTTRESAVTSLINLIPYIPLSKFNYWLDKIWQLVETSLPSESIFLTDFLWKVISENLDLNRSELAYHWWYELKHLPLKASKVVKL